MIIVLKQPEKEQAKQNKKQTKEHVKQKLLKSIKKFDNYYYHNLEETG